MKPRNIIFSVLLLSVFCAGGFPAKAASLNDALICWWNFEGATLEEQMADKALAGKSKDDLTVVADDTGSGVVVNNGIVFIKNTVNNILKIDEITEDTKDFSSKTIFLHFKPTGSSNLATVFFYNKESVRIFVNSGSTDGLMTFRVWLNNSSSKAANFPADASRTGDENGWFYIAVTLSYNKNAQTVDVVNYISTDGKNYLSQSTTVANVDTMERSSALYISKSARTMTAAWPFILRCFYDRVLTEDEIKSITSPPVTTSAPSTTTASGGTTAPSTTTSPVTGYLPVSFILPMVMGVSFLVIVNRKRKVLN